MGWLRTIWDELLGMFVDDVDFALPILIWVVLAAVALPRLGLPGAWPAIVLAAGLLAILVVGAVRKARR
jgi:hypothetical protein